MASNLRTRALRSLADDLRSRGDVDLGEVIRNRPDIAEPVPSDIAELAARASTVHSVRQALDDLDRRAIQVLAVLAVADQPAKPSELPEAFSHPDLLLGVVRSLWSRALLWGLEPTSLEVPVHVATAARDALSVVPDRPLDMSGREPKVEQSVDADQLDQLAGQHAFGAITVLGQLCETWAARPPAALKTGGLGARELGATATTLQLSEPTTSFWIELASAAGLISEAEATKSFAPTIGFDAWVNADLADQWARLASAWIRCERDADQVGELGADNQKLLALGPGLESPGLPRLRRAVLSVLSQVEPGSIVGTEEIEAVLADQLPRLRTTDRASAVRSVVSQAELIGVTARGALSTAGRALSSPTPSPELTAGAARAMLPKATEEFLAQADLTLVVPGPPSPALRSLLNLVADVESTGAAVVYRVTPASIARILDTGRGPQEILDELASRSVTPLPQPLEYLVNDISRRHGMVRLGAVDSYIRSEDEAVILAIMAHPRAAGLGLVRVSPTVVVSAAPAAALLEIARELGHSPVAEGVDGSVVSVPRVVHRAPDVPVSVDRGTGFDTVFVGALVRALRRIEEQVIADGVAAEVVGAGVPVPRMAVAQSVAALRAALTEGFPVWVGYADNAGSTTLRLVDIVAFDAGAISAFDHNACVIRTLALSRVTGVERAVLDVREPSKTSRHPDATGAAGG